MKGTIFLAKLCDSKFWHPSLHTDFYSRIIQRSFWKKMWGLHQFSREPILILWYSNNFPFEEFILLSSLLFFSSLIVNWPNIAGYSFGYGTVLQNHFQWLHLEWLPWEDIFPTVKANPHHQSLLPCLDGELKSSLKDKIAWAWKGGWELVNFYSQEMGVEKACL